MRFEPEEYITNLTEAEEKLGREIPIRFNLSIEVDDEIVFEDYWFSVESMEASWNNYIKAINDKLDELTQNEEE